MYFDNAEGNVFRPPSEAHSFILRVTVGCSHNKCTYCNMYRNVRFRMRSMAEIELQIKKAAVYAEFIKRIFLADGDALILPTSVLLEILTKLKAIFPKLQRVSCYASPGSILRKSPEDLKLLREHGLLLVYYGLETGSDRILRDVNKGVSAAEAIEAGQKIVAGGIKLSVMIISGLGGVKNSALHAAETAKAVNLIRPHMLSALTLMLYRGCELLEDFEAGRFEPLNPHQIMLELHDIISRIDLPTDSHMLFRSSHPSNYAVLAATLPRDRQKLCAQIIAAAQELKDVEYDVYNNVE